MMMFVAVQYTWVKLCLSTRDLCYCDSSYAILHNSCTTGTFNMWHICY